MINHLSSLLPFLMSLLYMDTQVTLKPLSLTRSNYLIIQTCHDHLKVIISNDVPLTDLFLPDDQTRPHLRSISRHIHYLKRITFVSASTTCPQPPVQGPAKDWTNVLFGAGAVWGYLHASPFRPSSRTMTGTRSQPQLRGIDI